MSNKSTIFSDDVLLRKILVSYRPNCCYLQKAFVEVDNVRAGGQFKGLMARGNFFIPEPCYIQSTGHFNAVEFNICYNQLAYYFLAECVQHQLLDIFSGWDIEKYCHRQLSDFFIVKLTSSFRKRIDPKQFYGSMMLNKIIINKERTIFIDTQCSFSDDQQGKSEGQILLAITTHKINITNH
jgi:hypothetical protein